MTRVRIPRNDAQVLDETILLEGEAVYDTTNQVLRIGDGETAGGVVVGQGGDGISNFGIANVLDYGAVGNGSHNDTTAVQAAINTGMDVEIPEGYTFAVTGLTGFFNNRRYFGGGKIKKTGAASVICMLPDESDGVWFDNIEIDGSRGSYSIGNNGAGIMGYLAKSLKVTNCYIHDCIDSAIKLRDCARLIAYGNHIKSISENGIEIRTYPTDVRTRTDADPEGVEYSGTRPIVEGGHRILNNTFELVTRIEVEDGPIVDSCAVTMDGKGGIPIRDCIISGNTFIDCLRSIFTENYGEGSEIDGFVVTDNTIENGVNGGQAQGIYCKVGIGVVSGRNVIITGNTLKNVVNYDSGEGTNTCGIAVSQADLETTTENVTISNNSIVDDTGDAQRMEYGIHCLTGTNLRVYGNRINGFRERATYFTEGLCDEVVCYANSGGEEDTSWMQPVPFVFHRTDIPQAAAAYDVWSMGATGADVAVLGCPGRVVGISLRATDTMGTLYTVKVFRTPGVEIAELTLDDDYLEGILTGTKRISSNEAVQLNAGDQIWVKFTANGDAAVGLDITATVMVDIGYKL